MRGRGDGGQAGPPGLRRRGPQGGGGGLAGRAATLGSTIARKSSAESSPPSAVTCCVTSSRHDGRMPGRSCCCARADRVSRLRWSRRAAEAHASKACEGDPPRVQIPPPPLRSLSGPAPVARAGPEGLPSNRLWIHAGELNVTSLVRCCDHVVMRRCGLSSARRTTLTPDTGEENRVFEPQGTGFFLLLMVVFGDCSSGWPWPGSSDSARSPRAWPSCPLWSSESPPSTSITTTTRPGAE